MLLVTATSLAAACDSLQPTVPELTDPSSSLHRAPASDPTPSSISLEKIGEFVGGGEGAAEITGYNEVSKRLFVVNGALGNVDVLDMSDPSYPQPIGTLSVTVFGRGATSVATDKNTVAVAVAGTRRRIPVQWPSTKQLRSSWSAASR